VRLAQLSQDSGVPVATIKFYLREKLIPPGVIVSPRLAEYGQEHVARLRLVRSLAEGAKLSLPQIRDVLALIDDRTVTGADLIRLLAQQIRSQDTPVTEGPLAQALVQVDTLLQDLDWTVPAWAVARSELAEALTLLRSYQQDMPPDVLLAYARLGEQAALLQIGQLQTSSSAELVISVLTARLAGDAALLAMARLAFAHHMRMHLDPAPEPPQA